MNKFSLLTIFLGVAAAADAGTLMKANGVTVAGSGLSCTNAAGIKTAPGPDYQMCSPDVGNSECSSAYDSNQMDDKTRAYVDCMRVASMSVKQLTCPAFVDKAEVCVADSTVTNGQNTECARWAEAGECFKMPDSKSGGYLFMIPNCMNTCCNACAYDRAGNCPTRGRETPDRCRNRYSTSSTGAMDVRKEVACVSWAQAGECDKNPRWMYRNCAKHCCPGCNPKAPAPPPIPTPAPVIRQPVQYSYQQPYQQGFLPSANFGGGYNFGGNGFYGR